MYSQNPYQAVENNLQDIEQHQLKMTTVQNGPLMYNKHLQSMTNASFEAQNIEQHEITNKFPVYKEASMYNGHSQSMASAPSAPPAQIVPKEQTIISYQPVGPLSTNMICPSCRSNIKTLVEHRPSTATHILGLLLCSICCCCLPYFIDFCRNVNHTCPNCHAFVGTYLS
ncbi:lipopolysaccharide-induced tumor necrosis factor-alpha factor homolog [Lucilia sericata]|uniref:lipopolysaccharide-induced tumor necrosis factor-alpha factor homolog n=1 Tax=Lucilia sericata TaxID=13632 RepID=UPI0018A8582C|nr:lipopolysaccharide-induced tumor necrosis factor-alpha factor homolog [Lucilia sericata]